mmetsp:Transcript_16863/g.38712  ORF Transcript_16863/g.38712 Transcript_16863/m.38712 type:complete len:264 (-) Transcript_16863:725-1516(-)
MDGHDRQRPQQGPGPLFVHGIQRLLLQDFVQPLVADTAVQKGRPRRSLGVEGGFRSPAIGEHLVDGLVEALHGFLRRALHVDGGGCQKVRRRRVHRGARQLEPGPALVQRRGRVAVAGAPLLRPQVARKERYRCVATGQDGNRRDQAHGDQLGPDVRPSECEVVRALLYKMSHFREVRDAPKLVKDDRRLQKAEKAVHFVQGDVEVIDAVDVFVSQGFVGFRQEAPGIVQEPVPVGGSKVSDVAVREQTRQLNTLYQFFVREL